VTSRPKELLNVTFQDTHFLKPYDLALLAISFIILVTHQKIVCLKKATEAKGN